MDSSGGKKAIMGHKTSDLFKIFSPGKNKLIELHILMLLRCTAEIYVYVDVMERVYLQGCVVLGQQ